MRTYRRRFDLLHKYRQGLNFDTTWKFEIRSAAEELESHVLARWRTELYTEITTSAEEILSGDESKTVSMHKISVKETLDFIDESIEFYFTHHVPK